MGDSVTASFSRGLALATSFPVTLCGAVSREMVSDVSVFVFVNSIHNSNPRKPFCPERFDHDFNTVTFFMRTG